MKSEFEKFDPKKFVEERILEGKKESTKRRGMLKEKPNKKTANINFKTLKLLAKLQNKKLIRKNKRNTLVIHAPEFVTEAKNIFFNREKDLIRRGVWKNEK